MSMFRRILFVASIAIAVVQSTFAASPTVIAVLSDSQPAVGQMVQLEIKVNGANSANVPETISIDGLEIHQTGTSRQFEMHNFDVSSSVTYNYTILPLKAGKFKIPPQTVRVGNDSLRTAELVLNVAQGSSSSSSSAGSAQSRQSTVGSKVAFAELVVAKKDAYVGEMVPAEIRLGFDSRARGRLHEGPELSGQGFTTQKLQQPRENLETIGGRTYQVLTFKTAIAAARPGKFEIGPVTAKAAIVLPRRPSAPRTTRPRSPFDLFNSDDPFSDPFFSDPFGNMGERTELPIKSETAILNVKPLPQNVPPNFSGAIGNFAMNVDAKPKTVQVGDPITIQVEGGAAPAPTVAVAQAAPATPTATVAVTPAPTAKPQDILYQMSDLGRVRSFTPIYERPVFWMAQLAPLILLLGFIGWKIRQAKIDNRDAQRVAALRQESSELLRKLRRGEYSPQEYFSNASRVVRVKTALAKNVNPNAVDAETAAKAFDLAEDERAQLRTLFDRSDELRFSGSGNGAKTISNDEREEVLRLLESLRV